MFWYFTQIEIIFWMPLLAQNEHKIEVQLSEQTAFLWLPSKSDILVLLYCDKFSCLLSLSTDLWILYIQKLFPSIIALAWCIVVVIWWPIKTAEYRWELDLSWIPVWCVCWPQFRECWHSIGSLWTAENQWIQDMEVWWYFARRASVTLNLCSNVSQSSLYTSCDSELCRQQLFSSRAEPCTRPSMSSRHRFLSSSLLSV